MLTKTEQLMAYVVLCKALEKFNIQNRLIAHTYNGTSVISVEMKGLQAKVCKLAPKAVFNFCYAYCLNLVLK